MLSSVGARSSHPNFPLVPVGGFPPPHHSAMGRSAPLTTVTRSAVSSPSIEMAMRVCWHTRSGHSTGTVSLP